MEDVNWLVSRGFPLAAVNDFVSRHRNLAEAECELLSVHTRLRQYYRHHVARELDADDVSQRQMVLDVDGVLATLASGLEGGVLLESPAGVISDPHWCRGTSPEELGDAMGVLVRCLGELSLKKLCWVTERAELASVGNDLRLGKTVVEVERPDDIGERLRGRAHLASSDPELLDTCKSWFNMVAYALNELKTKTVSLE